VIYVNTNDDEGFYNLFFHSCPSYESDSYLSNFNVDIEENNNGNYLSSTEMPLPLIYLIFSMLHFLSGIFWVYYLKRSKNVLKIHNLMTIVVFVKSLSLILLSINFYFIKIRGEQLETWTVLYSITHLIKEIFLYITIILIGAGWTFVKNKLSQKDKIILMIVIPLQILANISEIILSETEKGSLGFSRWREVFIIADLICCVAVLFPVRWTIKHLRISSVDEEVRKIFRQFLIMLVCYVYFTRIIV
jgi:hypothetical protein